VIVTDLWLLPICGCDRSVNVTDLWLLPICGFYRSVVVTDVLGAYLSHLQTSSSPSKFLLGLLDALRCDRCKIFQKSEGVRSQLLQTDERTRGCEPDRTLFRSDEFQGFNQVPNDVAEFIAQVYQLRK
jgi:hypothetical protein